MKRSHVETGLPLISTVSLADRASTPRRAAAGPAILTGRGIQIAAAGVDVVAIGCERIDRTRNPAGLFCAVCAGIGAATEIQKPW